jgi:alkylation response protein AidB-like acyl-CoA dehydrogenase
MRFVLDDEQRQFAASLDGLLTGSDVPEVARRWADGDTEPGRALWKQLAEVGVTALAVPEEHGGLPADAVDLVVALEELGRHAVPGPVVESLAVAPTLLAGDGDRLAALASGELIATVAAPPHVPYALDADVAGLVLVVDGDGVALGEPADPEPSMDPTRRLFPVTAARTLGPAATDEAFDIGALACAAQLLGAGEALLAAAVAHAGRREQFGRPIGQFQAVQHQLADVHVGLELARPLVHAAALAVGSGTASRDVSAAKVAAGQAARQAARAALQVHGAIGYTREHDLWLWLLKVPALSWSWGTPAFHRARVRQAW